MAGIRPTTDAGPPQCPEGQPSHRDPLGTLASAAVADRERGPSDQPLRPLRRRGSRLIRDLHLAVQQHRWQPAHRRALPRSEQPADHAAHHSIDIAAPAKTVWEVLVDFAAFPAWNPFITQAE